MKSLISLTTQMKTSLWKVCYLQSFFALPARGSDKSCSSDGGNGRVLMVIVLDAFEPLQINNAKHGQRQADPKQ